MKPHVLRVLSAAALLLMTTAAAFAQAVGTGTVTGRIVDASGAVVPGVTVTLKSPEALGVFTGVTDAQGMYRIGNLPPATYELRAELDGFQTVVRQVTVRLGATAPLDLSMSVGSVTETVNVTGEVPIVDPERAGLSVNINNAALTSVPVTSNRRFQDIWLMLPGINVRPDSNESFGSERSTKLDGMDVTDPFSGDAFAVNLNYEAIQDVEVKTLGAEAEDGSRMVGQFMNVVTKSGGNDLHGSASIFVVPQRFNGSNVTGIPPNRRRDTQPDLTLGGPIERDRIWFFTAYRRLQEDQTLNNAPVPRQRRGNLWFVKATSELGPGHRIAVTFQDDRTTLANAVIRGTVGPSRSLATLTSSPTSATVTALSSATPQITSPSAFGTQTIGGPLVGWNYTWVVGSRQLFQFVGSYMISKPNNNDPIGDLVPTRVIQSNPSGNISANLTTVALEGSFGAVDRSKRSMVYLAPSYSFVVERWGMHEFKGGAEIYPSIRNVTSDVVAPVEFYFRPPGTTGAADVLFERDTLRSFDGGASTVGNTDYEHYYAGYFQDRWKPTSKVSVKAGFRVERNLIWSVGRSVFLPPLLPAGFPTDTSDKVWDQPIFQPNFGIAIDAGRWGVLRGTAQRSYEWLDLGGGDGTVRPPFVLATDVVQASPRTVAPVLNQTLPGAFPIGVNFNGSDIGRTYMNEFSGGWEHKLPAASAVNVTFVWRRFWDYQASDDVNVIRNPNTGALVDRPFPRFDAVLKQYTPNYTWQENRTLQFLYTRNFAERWGINASYWYNIQWRHQDRFNPTRDTIQFAGITPEANDDAWVNPRHNARLSTYTRLPFDFQASIFYSYTQGRRSDVLTGDFPLNAVAPRVVLSNGRTVADPFFNPAYPRARVRGVDMIKSADSHVVNLRIQKMVSLPSRRRLEFSGDVFNLFNTAGFVTFLSADARSSNFAVPTQYVPARVGQLGMRVVF
jgi:hypothetical protein